MSSFNQKKIYLSLMIGTFVCNIIPIWWLHGPVLSDEIGTLASVEFLANCDWSEYIARMGLGYYKYGQGLLYFWVIMLFKNTAIAYQIMLVINAICLSVIPCIVFYLTQNIMKIEELDLQILASVLIGIIPFSFFWSKFVWAETVLILCNWLCLLLLYKLTINTDNRKRIAYSILLSMIAIFSYASHVRGVVTILAVLITIFLYKIKFKRWCVEKYSFFLCILLGGIFEKVIADYLKSSLWISEIQYNSTESLFDYYVDPKFWSYRGLKTLAKTIIGWLYASVNSTYGLLAVGLILSVIIVIKILKEKDTKQDTFFIMHFFTLISFIGCFVLGLIFFVPGTFSTFYEYDISRMDKIIYARYVSCTLGPLMLIAFYHIAAKTKYLTSYVKFVIISLVTYVEFSFIIFLSDYFENSEMAYTQIYSLPILFEHINSITASSSGINKSLFILAVFVLLFVIGFVFVNSNKIMRFIMTALVVITLIIDFSNTANVLIPTNKYYYETVKTVDEFLEKYSSIPQKCKNIVIGDVSRGQYPYQYSFEDYSVYMLEDLYYVDNAFIVIDNIDQFLDGYHDVEEWYTVEDNESFEKHIIIKGEQLKNVLQDQGGKLIQIK